jgi:hypothetical protein
MLPEDALRHLRDAVRELSSEERLRLFIRALWVILLTPGK